MKIIEVKIISSKRDEMILITSKIDTLIQSEKFENGKITLFVPHTTAAVTINENADPDVRQDFLFGLKKISPNLADYKHYEGNSDAHIKSSLIGNSQEILVNEGEMLLGSWQGIYFCEFDGPRNRKLIIGLDGK